MTDHQTAPFTCPACGVVQDGLTSFETPFLPDDGDAIICLYCETINVWENGGLRLATAEEQMVYATDDRLQHLLWAMRAAKAIHGPPKGG